MASGVAPNESVLSAYRVPRSAPTDRPYITCIMIASIDGATTIDGLSGALGNPTDHALLAVMRQQSDAVLVGAHTAVTERYQPTGSSLRLVVAGRSTSLDWDTDLWRDPQTTLLTTTSRSDVAPHVAVLRFGESDIDFVGALQELRCQGVERIICEGGPRLNGALANLDLIDEICLTVSPLLVTGESSRLTRSIGAALRPYALQHALVDNDLLFLRYLRRER